MKPDALFKCIKPYMGRTSAGQSIRLVEGKEYCRTQVDLKQVGHSSKQLIYFLHDWESPSRSGIELSPKEFERLLEKYLVHHMALS